MSARMIRKWEHVSARAASRHIKPGKHLERAVRAFAVDTANHMAANAENVTAHPDHLAALEERGQRWFAKYAQDNPKAARETPAIDVADKAASEGLSWEESQAPVAKAKARLPSTSEQSPQTRAAVSDRARASGFDWNS